jgi:RNA polymerase sigma factor (sigma-70 family)
MAPDFVELVKLAVEGDAAAKEALVEALKRLVWRSIGDFGLSNEDRQDVFAGTFCRLFERIGTIREAEKLPGWIATTARNEARTLIRARTRMQPWADLGDTEDREGPHDERMLDAEVRVALKAAYRRLSPTCQELLRLVSAVPRLPYEEVGQLLKMPHGSIGPTRQRCLERLRSTPEMRPFLEGGQP